MKAKALEMDGAPFLIRPKRSRAPSASIWPPGPSTSTRRVPTSTAPWISIGFTIARYRPFAPSDNPVYLAGRERIYEGMRMAGVPEG